VISIFVGEKIMAGELEKLYGDIDALELYVGLMMEKRRYKQLFGETLTEMGSPYSLKGYPVVNLVLFFCECCSEFLEF